MLFVLCLNMLILPVIVSFFNDDTSPQIIVFNTLSDAVFIADIIANFRTGVITGDFAEQVSLFRDEKILYVLVTINSIY